MTPVAISVQNARSTSRRCDGWPGDFIGDLPVSSLIQPAGRPIRHLHIKVLRPPVEPGQYTATEFSNRLADWDVNASFGSTSDCFDNAAMESTWAALKREIRHIHGDWTRLTRSELRTILFDYIETFYSRIRHQARLEHRTAAEAYAASRAA